jgi:hypothetical protein
VVELKFINRDARPRVTELSVARGGCADICLWYGAFHAGDRYSVYINDVQQKLGINGELLSLSEPLQGPGGR